MKYLVFIFLILSISQANANQNMQSAVDSIETDSSNFLDCVDDASEVADSKQFNWCLQEQIASLKSRFIKPEPTTEKAKAFRAKLNAIDNAPTKVKSGRDQLYPVYGHCGGVMVDSTGRVRSSNAMLNY